MHLNALAILSFASIISASSIPEMSSSHSDLEKSVRYNCKGSTLCGNTINLRKWCDIAVNSRLIRNDVINYGAPGSGLPSGASYGQYRFGTGCGVFIEGNKGCKMSGNTIWWAYQDIRHSGCNICGQKDYQNGCYLTINYVGTGLVDF